jgi:hypothetical protein
VDDETVIRALYDRYRRPLFGYVLRSVGGDHQYAEDIVQETMTRAWAHSPQLDPERAGRWLFTVARPEPAPLELSRPRIRHTRRWMLVAAAATVVAASGVLGWQTLDEPTSVTWSATNGVDGIDTTAELISRGWGTDIQLRMTDLRPGEHCTLIVHGRDGTTETAGWWATASTYQAEVPASTSIPLTDIDRLEVVTAGGTVLSTVSPGTR